MSPAPPFVEKRVNTDRLIDKSSAYVTPLFGFENFYPALPFAFHSDNSMLWYDALRSAGFRLWLPACLLVFVLSQPAHAQINGKIADKPIAIWYARDVTPRRMIDYVMSLTERLDIGSMVRNEFEKSETQAQAAGMQAGIDEPVYGVAWYMVAGVIPSFESVSFQPVVDEDDARRMLNAGKANYGQNGYLEDLGNNCFKSGYRRSYESPLPEGYDE